MPILGSPLTANSPTGLPISADYSSDKSGAPEKVFVSPVTKNGPFGLPVAAYDTSTRIIERRDTVFTLNSPGRSGDVGVDDNEDNVVATGLTGAAAYSNDWFNTDWFSSEWFNADWFNAALFTNGDVDFTEDPDDVVSSGRVEMSGYGDGQEDHDTTVTYGAVGNSVVGLAYIYESRDDTSITGRVIVGLGGNILEDRDIVVTTGSTGTVSIKLSWSVSGVFTEINIYRSDDNVTFEQIASLPNTATEYTDDVPDLSKDYYYYITGIQTTGIPVQSDTAFVDLPN